MQAWYLFTVTHLSTDRDSNKEMNAVLRIVFFISCLGTSLWKRRISSALHPTTTSSWNGKFSVYSKL